MLRRLLIGLFLSACCAAQSQADCQADTPPSTPIADFHVHQDGTVTHTLTGLMWMRCPLGQDWNGSTCAGSVAGYSWSQAMQAAVDSRFAGYSDWRLPNVKELRTIVEVACSFPSLNVEVFPTSGPGTWFWSSSQSVGNPGYAWYVLFGGVTSGHVDGRNVDGRVNAAAKIDENRSVRLVRSGQ